jgi:hypothetical protein
MGLKSDAAAEKSKDQLSRDFSCRSTFATKSANKRHRAAGGTVIPSGARPRENYRR